MKRLWMILSLLSISALSQLALQSLRAQNRPASDAPRPLPTIAEKTAGMDKLSGFFPVYWDAKAGKMWLEIDKWNTEFLYIESLPAGIGSNDIGLDRGQLGASSIVRFDRSGPRI